MGKTSSDHRRIVFNEVAVWEAPVMADAFCARILLAGALVAAAIMPLAAPGQMPPPPPPPQPPTDQAPTSAPSNYQLLIGPGKSCTG